MLLLALASSLPLSLVIVWQIVKEINKYHRRERDRLLNQMDGLLDRIQYGRGFPVQSAETAVAETVEEDPLPEWSEL